MGVDVMAMAREERADLADFLRTHLEPRGVRLVATDLDWARGRGPEAHEEAEAVLMTLAGRSGVAQATPYSAGLGDSLDGLQRRRDARAGCLAALIDLVLRLRPVLLVEHGNAFIAEFP